jgi:hypothetical protein
MSLTLNERNPNIQSILIGSVATTTTVVMPGCYFRKHCKIKNIWLVDQAGISEDPTQHVQVTLQDTSGSPVSYGTVDTANGAALANKPLQVPLATPDDTDADEEDIPAGTQLNVKAQTFGTAVLTKAVLLVEYYPL